MQKYTISYQVHVFSLSVLTRPRSRSTVNSDVLAVQGNHGKTVCAKTYHSLMLCKLFCFTDVSCMVQNHNKYRRFSSQIKHRWTLECSLNVMSFYVWLQRFTIFCIVFGNTVICDAFSTATKHEKTQWFYTDCLLFIYNIRLFHICFCILFKK